MFTLCLCLLLTPQSCLASTPMNTNFPYTIANGGMAPPHRGKYIEILSRKISTAYAEVFWTQQKPVPLPASFVHPSNLCSINLSCWVLWLARRWAYLLHGSSFDCMWLIVTAVLLVLQMCTVTCTKWSAPVVTKAVKYAVLPCHTIVKLLGRTTQRNPSSGITP